MQRVERTCSDFRLCRVEGSSSVCLGAPQNKISFLNKGNIGTIVF